MISVLIPTYNYKCYTLVFALQQQLEKAETDYEIIVADDGGKDQVVAISNHRINDLDHCQFIRREKNTGRAAIRNFLAQQAKGEWLLFMDSDAEVVSEDFISKYLDAISDEADVIVGGLVNPDSMPSKEVSLRYKYEKAAEYQRPAAYREEHPYEHFATFNFMIRKSVIMEIPFDETCTEYGYEDALMGIELKHNGKKIKHIDNPLRHLGFEPNSIFLKKTETALCTLNKIHDKMADNTTLDLLATNLKQKHISWVVVLVYKLFHSLLRKNLIGNNPNLKVFAFYKLGYYLSL